MSEQVKKDGELMDEKEKVVNMILQHTLIDLQRSGAGYFKIDPRTWNEFFPAIAILNTEVDLIMEHKSGLSASQRKKALALHQQLAVKKAKEITNETNAVGTK